MIDRALSVVSKVPTEVLAEIFHLLCKKSIFLCELNNSCCKEDFPWAVGLVCRQWRTAFLSYPPIWASLTLSDSYYDTSRIANPEARGESYAKEINRRLALYLERSGGYPLGLEIFLWSDHNKAFTMMALEMLLACSHRWQTAKFELWRQWPLDSILPCKGKLPTLKWLDIRVDVAHNHKHAQGIFEIAPRLTHAYIQHYGWILPWTQLTELILILDGVSIIENGDVLNLFPMLHNIRKLRFRLDYDELAFGAGFPLRIPQFAPTPLNQLRVLEVPHPAILSWFEAPSLCEIYFRDYQRDYDIHEQISSLIQRSSCRIRKLSFGSGRKFNVGKLEDVEELVINGIRSSINISSLPNLRLLTIVCRIDNNFKSFMNCLTTTLKSARVPTRSECSSGTPIGLLERVMVELRYDRKEPKSQKGS